MNASFTSERGMSLVEATIIVMVLSILTAVTAPSMADYIEDAKRTTAKEDVEVIGTAIYRMVKDTGLGCVSDTPTTASTACNKANRVDLLTTGGTDPAVTAADYTAPTGAAAATTNNWLGSASAVGSGNRDTVDNQLILNATSTSASYALGSFTSGGGPKSGLGWRGAYLTGTVGPDPWGHQYQANTIFLRPASDSTATSGTNGASNAGWVNDVIVVSPGSDGSIATPFGNNTTGGTATTGDDIVYVVTGSSR